MPPDPNKRALPPGKTLLVCAILAVWAAGWTFPTVLVDKAILRTFARQPIAVTYPSVAGTVVRNEVALPRHRYLAAYAYEVDDRRYEGTRLRFDRDFFTREWAAAHPVGSAVRVFYNPRDPSDAGLEPGLTAADLALPLAAIFFNVVALGAWTVLLLLLLYLLIPAFQKAHLPAKAQGVLAWIVVAIVRSVRFRWIYLVCAAVAATILVLGVIAGRGAARFLPLVAWALVLGWLIVRVARPWRRQEAPG